MDNKKIEDLENNSIFKKRQVKLKKEWHKPRFITMKADEVKEHIKAAARSALCETQNFR